jgi:hypothetical protein
VIAMGSILKFADAETTVWGTGLSRLDSPVCPNAEYLAVRGPLTRDVVLASGGQCPPVYGDPALLLPGIYTPKALSQPKTHKVGLILHHNHQGFEAQVPEDWTVIDIIAKNDDEIEQFIEDLCSCEVIMSTSLHGIILSHAYEVPAVWCDISDSTSGIPGDGLKFYDYYHSVGIDEPKCYRYSKEKPFVLPDDYLNGSDSFLAARMPDLEKLKGCLLNKIGSR